MHDGRKGRGAGQGRRHSAPMERHRHDQAVFHRLLERHTEIDRSLEIVANGIRSLTRSRNPELVALLHEHVPSMHERLETGFRLRRWDPLYEAIFDRADAISMEIRLLPDGVEVIEYSDDPDVAALIKAHGATVDAFVARGQAAAAKVSPMPDSSQ